MGTTKTLSVLAIAAVLGAGLLAAKPSSAQDDAAAEVEELRREIKTLRAQIQAMKTAVGEAAEYERLRATAFSRALAAADHPSAAHDKEALAAPVTAAGETPAARVAKEPSAPARAQKRGRRPGRGTVTATR